jgi:hypothetical protein
VTPIRVVRQTRTVYRDTSPRLVSETFARVLTDTGVSNGRHTWNVYNNVPLFVGDGTVANLPITSDLWVVTPQLGDSDQRALPVSSGVRINPAAGVGGFPEVGRWPCECFP